MKKQRSDETRRRNTANAIRRITNTGMAEHKPAESAKKWFDRPPYQAGKLIRAQGEQIKEK